MRPAFTLRLASLDDTQHTVVLIDMLNQFTHGGTISPPADNETPRAQRRVIYVTSDAAKCNTLDRLRHAKRPHDPACSIATRGHAHTTSADTRHTCATHNYESGMPLWDVQVLLGHAWPTTTVGYLASARTDPERASLESSRRAVRRLSGET
ncbi:tyrosine-type recombinase/integrase [Streptomyces olivochromogenes]|uniref:tyrosine-type recombinase/integrase n=1 Tax=Streptomyces olivochromogenes TaxID=1963 RepID=UPI0036DD3794